jgi:protein-tyrosine phosphatase
LQERKFLNSEFVPLSLQIEVGEFFFFFLKGISVIIIRHWAQEVIKVIDIHTHILPGMDDGAQTMQESLMMAELAVESGVHTVIATPHCNIPGYYDNYFSPFFYEQVIRFRKRLEREGICLRVFTGMEIFITDDVMERMAEGDLIPLNHSDYYLVEFPFDIYPEEIERKLLQIQKSDRIPILAHPERYYCIQDMPEMLYGLLERGCRLQCNKGSFFGKFGRHAQKTVRYFAENGWIHAVASDAHSPYERTTFMGDIKEYLEKEYSYAYAKKVLYENPKRILQNQRIPFDGRKIEEERIWY